MAMADPNRHTYSVFKQHFTVDRRCKLVKELGQGAYGIVCAAKYVDAPNSPGIAVKKLTNIFSKSIITKRALREIKLLRHLRGHKHITSLYDIDIINRDNFNEVYLYEELMDCDLHQIIKSRQSLTDAHFQSFVYQTLCGLKYIHSANVLHRDLKPSNLLVNADCELKICDFGLARGVHDNPDLNAGALTEYVATRWYRAPELILAFQSYSKAIDVWSVGCILAELMYGKTLFQGKDFVHQLTLILNVLGKPSPQTMKAIGSAKAQEYVANLELDQAERVTLDELFTDVNPLGLDLLKRMLVFDPADRITVDEALEHPYLKIWRDPKDEIECPTQFDFNFEKLSDQEDMRKAILHEFDDFRAELAAQTA